jgi:hypothetical protein
MEILIRNKPSHVEEACVGPIRRNEEIRRTGTGL